MAVSITPEDVSAFAPGIDREQVAALIPGAVAAAIAAAPCLGRVAPDSNTAKAAVFILSGALARMIGNTSSPLGVDSETGGPFSVKFSPVVATFSDKELKTLRALCSQNKAFALDTIPRRSRVAGCPDFGALPADYAQSRVDEAPAGCGGHLPWCETLTDLGCTCGWAER